MGREGGGRNVDERSGWRVTPSSRTVLIRGVRSRHIGGNGGEGSWPEIGRPRERIRFWFLYK